MAVHQTTLPQGWRRFDATGWAGSERFHDGTDPLIKSVQIDGFDADLIVDASGAAVVLYEATGAMVMWTDAAPSAVVYVLTADVISVDTLRRIGFTREVVLA